MPDANKMISFKRIRYTGSSYIIIQFISNRYQPQLHFLLRHPRRYNQTGRHQQHAPPERDATVALVRIARLTAEVTVWNLRFQLTQGFFRFEHATLGHQ